eukprot:m.142218 g.142218  ORF g.142218 m.142218 type:complete len:100 (+) comp22908_c1_seq1:375-674(+)
MEQRAIARQPARDMPMKMHPHRCCCGSVRQCAGFFGMAHCVCRTCPWVTPTAADQRAVRRLSGCQGVSAASAWVSVGARANAVGWRRGAEDAVWRQLIL